jgi:hypothetical protein
MLTFCDPELEFLNSNSGYKKNSTGILDIKILFWISKIPISDNKNLNFGYRKFLFWISKFQQEFSISEI